MNMFTMRTIKRLLLAAQMLLVAVPSFAQMVSNNNEDGVNKPTREARFRPYREGQVIVKFKTGSGVRVQKVKGKFKTSAVSAVDRVMNALGVAEAEELMPLSGAITTAKPRRAKAPNGRVVEEPDLSQLYCLSFDTAKVKHVHEAVEMLKEVSEVEYAEPNYLAFISADGAATDSATYVSEPLYSEQWAPAAINLPALWNMPLADAKRPVIAILDTGVDINHPDLKDNIWTNEKEANGSDFEDDDNNGYCDDVHGWDFIHNTAIISDGMDGNGHGTHCAGIAAAVGNNGIGITGANPNALILPIKVMNDDGTGDIATIVRGIDYAVASGANILSMSLGGGNSTAEYQALSKAYAAYIPIVAAAGNSGTSIYDIFGGGLQFPAAYDIVLGVMASGQNGQRAGYSNFDPDGPFYTQYANTDRNYSQKDNTSLGEFWNYDLMAPGTGIMSTLPGGKYGKLSGTSMATPLVAGALSRMLQVKGFDYAKDYGIFGDMAEAKMKGTDVFDAKAAVSYDESNREVALRLLAITIDDKEFGDGDGNADAGETIAIYPTIRSLWGEAKNIKVSITENPNVNDSAYTIVENGADFGFTVNSRGSATAKNPIKIKIGEKVNDGYTIPLTFDFTCDNMSGEPMHTHQRAYIDVVNAVEIGGMITKNTTLYPNVHYRVTKPIAVPKGVTLTIKPGTVLKFEDGTGISVTTVLKEKYVDGNYVGRHIDDESSGKLIMQGTPDSLIVLDGMDGKFRFFSSRDFNDFLSIENSIPVEYVFFKNVSYAVDLLANNYFGGYCLKNCIFDNVNSTAFPTLNCWADRCNFLNIEVFNNSLRHGVRGCNFFALTTRFDYDYFYYFDSIDYTSTEGNNYLTPVYNNGDYNNGEKKGYVYMWSKHDTPTTVTFEHPSYWGSSKESIVRKYVWDIEKGVGFGYFDLSNMLKRPNKEAHGCVWKVVVDGYDAQDDFDEMPPLGVGRHKFEVFYNRDDMDTTTTPTITMGLQEPYTQTSINQDGFWSVQDSVSVYTAYLDIDGKMTIDGLNRIVVTGAKDHDHFDVPTENFRFNVMVQKAGSMSTGMMAEAGLGKVNLSWNTTDVNFDDMMGYNLYRYTKEDKSDVAKINTSLLSPTDDSYTDTDVVPGTTYYYYIMEMYTDLTQSAISNVVAATPLTAQKGDANGSMSVDIADVVTEVNYITKQPTGTFIFEAADVNSDNAVDIFDVVGTVNIITTPTAAPEAGVSSTATYTTENGILYVNSPVALGGLQVMVEADEKAVITPLEALDGMEKVLTQMNENQRLFLSYSMSGKTIAAGKNAILQIGDHAVSDIKLSDAMGNNVMAINGNVNSGIGTIETVQFKVPYPNPFTSQLTVPYVVGKDGCKQAKFVMTDVMGRTVGSYNADATMGEHTMVISGDGYATGLYFLSLYVDGKLMQTSRILKR